MNRRPGGRVLVARLALPMDIILFGEIGLAIEAVVQRHGYTDVTLDLDDQGAIIATPPARGGAA